MDSAGVDDESSSQLLAFGGEEGSVLRLIVASSRFSLCANDGVLLNVECFGPKYGDCEGTSSNTDEGNNYSMHKRSMHNADEWPLVSYLLCYFFTPHPSFVLVFGVPSPPTHNYFSCYTSMEYVNRQKLGVFKPWRSYVQSTVGDWLF